MRRINWSTYKINQHSDKVEGGGRTDWEGRGGGGDGRSGPLESVRCSCVLGTLIPSKAPPKPHTPQTPANTPPPLHPPNPSQHPKPNTPPNSPPPPPPQVGVFVSIVSTKIPFKGAGKEYVGDDVDEMVAAVKAAIMACGLQLKVGGGVGRGWEGACGRVCGGLGLGVWGLGWGGARWEGGEERACGRWSAASYTDSCNDTIPSTRPTARQAKIARALAAREHQQRKRNLTKYIPNTASAIFAVLEAMAGAPAR